MEFGKIEQTPSGAKVTLIRDQVKSMADQHGEIAYTRNTRSLLDDAERLGFVAAVSGKFRQIEPGCLNSIYRILPKGEVTT